MALTPSQLALYVLQLNLYGNALCGIQYGEGTYTTVCIEAIAEALRVNASLKSLDLDNNSLGPGGGVALTDALRVNTSLKTLLASGKR